MNIAQITQQALNSGILSQRMANVIENLMWNPQLRDEELQALYRLQVLLEEGYVTAQSAHRHCHLPPSIFSHRSVSQNDPRLT